MSITGAALLSVFTFKFVRIGSEFFAALSVCCHGNPLPSRTFCADDKAALWQCSEKDTILFALLWCAVHPRQRRGNATEQLKANERSSSEGLADTQTYE